MRLRTCTQTRISECHVSEFVDFQIDVDVFNFVVRLKTKTKNAVLKEKTCRLIFILKEICPFLCIAYVNNTPNGDYC